MPMSVDGGIWTRANSRQSSLTVFPEWTGPSMGSGKAKSYFSDWNQRNILTKPAPMKKLARRLRERIDKIMTYFTHRITNALADGINRKNYVD
jgi:hypothetical protein